MEYDQNICPWYIYQMCINIRLMAEDIAFLHDLNDQLIREPDNIDLKERIYDELKHLCSIAIQSKKLIENEDYEELKEHIPSNIINIIEYFATNVTKNLETIRHEFGIKECNAHMVVFDNNGKSIRYKITDNKALR